MALQSTAFAELYGERLHRELGTEDVQELFTTVRRKKACNEAALEWVKRTKSFVKWVSITLTDDVREYDLEATATITADDFLEVSAEGPEYQFTDANGDVTYRSGRDFPRKDIAILQRESPGWRAADAANYPTSWHIRKDGGKVYFGLSEPPEIAGSESAAILLPYVARPLVLTDDADVPYAVSSDAMESLEPWLQAIVYFAAALLEPLRKGFAAEQRLRNLFAGEVAAYLQEQRPKGGQAVLLARNYYREARGRSGRGMDPRVDFA